MNTISMNKIALEKVPTSRRGFNSDLIESMKTEFFTLEIEDALEFPITAEVPEIHWKSTSDNYRSCAIGAIKAVMNVYPKRHLVVMVRNKNLYVARLDDYM